MCSHCWRKPLVGVVVVERSPELNDLVAMEVELGPGASASATLEGPSSSSSLSSLGWPFGLSSTCIAIHAPSPKGDEQRRCAQAQPSTSSSPVLASFQHQFVNLQSTFLLPFFSDVGESSSSDSEEVCSEAASSFFKDSRRITLGSLIGLPMDNSFHHFHVDDLATTITTTPRRSLQLPSCAGILELLRCGRPFSDPNSFGNLSDHEGEITAEMNATTTTTSTLAAFLQVESTGEIITKHSVRGDVACVDDTLSTSSHSPDWNDQFVSCHSVLSTEAHPLASSSSPKASSTPSQKPNRMQRSSSMKSFFSSICCRVDTVHRP